MKAFYKITLIALIIQVNTAFGQENANSGIQIIDVSKKQLVLMNKYAHESMPVRSTILIDSIYTPYRDLWAGYLGSEQNFTNWSNNKGFDELPKYSAKADKIDLERINNYFNKAIKKLKEMTGKEPRGKWYFFYGPKWTNLGGFGNGTMLVDLAHDANQSNKSIEDVIPHELNHQIYAGNENQNSGMPVLNRILNEGFACYVSYLYHQGTSSIAQELYYTDSDYELAKINEYEALNLLKKYYRSDSEKLSRNFASRSYKFSENLPAALGYYIGFRIAEEYVKLNGKDSWIDIYEMKPEEVLKKSKIIDY